MYGTSLQSLTLAIWGACRTPDGPGFEPLISEASECDSFEGKETPEGIFCHDSRTAWSCRSCARVFRWLWVTWPDSCGAVWARLFRRQPRADEAAWAAADGWIAQQSRRARRLPCRIYCCVRAWETPRSWGPAVSDSEIYRIQCGRFGPYRSCLRLAFVFFQGYEKFRVETEIFRKNIGDFLGTFGGSPRSSPRGRLGFAEGKAKRTSVFVRIRALEGPEGSQK